MIKLAGGVSLAFRFPAPLPVAFAYYSDLRTVLHYLPHVEVNHVVGDPQKVTKALMLSTYDTQAKRYVTWFFQSTGLDQ